MVTHLLPCPWAGTSRSVPVGKEVRVTLGLAPRRFHVPSCRDEKAAVGWRSGKAFWLHSVRPLSRRRRKRTEEAERPHVTDAGAGMLGPRSRASYKTARAARTQLLRQERTTPPPKLSPSTEEQASLWNLGRLKA